MKALLSLDAESIWSVVGMEAINVEDLKKPTMQLNLGGHTPDHQESLVIHLFGLALGLQREHQHSDFWDVLGKHLDVKKMKEDPKAGPTFKQEWAKAVAIPGEQPTSSPSEHDPDSIMNFRFAFL